MAYENVTANGKSSFTTFGLYVKARNIPVLEEKEVIEDIPFTTGSYDYSDIYGRTFHHDRTVTYTFDILGDDIDDLQANKDDFLRWLYSIRLVNMWDDAIPGRHFKNAKFLSSSSWTEDYFAGEISCNFRTYPYMVADDPTTFTYAITSQEDVVITNHGDVPVNVDTIVTDADIIINGASVVTGTTHPQSFLLPAGDTTLTISTASTANVSLTFYEETYGCIASS